MSIPENLGELSSDLALRMTEQADGTDSIVVVGALSMIIAAMYEGGDIDPTRFELAIDMARKAMREKPSTN